MGFASLPDYLASLSHEQREALGELRDAIGVAVPDGEDGLSYDMPVVLHQGRRVVHYAAWKRHLSIYPVPADPVPDDPSLTDELASYAAGRGTLKFPLGTPLPTALITRVAAALLRQLD